MVSEYLIFEAIKAILDADNTLSALLKRKGSTSKVFVGSEMELSIPPMIQVVGLTNDMNIVTTESEMTVYINAYSRVNVSGSIDFSEIENILQRVSVLIHDQSLSVSGHQVFAMFIEGRNAPIADRSMENVFFGGVRCRLFAIKTS